jgi:hypothetical protein
MFIFLYCVTNKPILRVYVKLYCHMIRVTIDGVWIGNWIY